MSGVKAARPFLVGIAGPSCSGKSVLARRAARLIPGALVLPLDAYYRDLSQLTARQRASRDFDCPDAIDRRLLVEQLRRLVRGDAVDRPVYSFVSHTRTGVRRVRPPDVLIVEGLFALRWSSVRRVLDLGVFLDTDHASCLRRRLRRDTRSRGRSAESVRARYERFVRPMFELHVRPTRRFADLVLDGEAALDDNAQILAARVRRALGGDTRGL